MKFTKYWLLVIAVILIAGGIFLLIRAISGEDSWIKDSRGVYVKHGNPASTPDYVLEQQEAIECAYGLYQGEAREGIFYSQCLGICGNYAVDVVHVPRIEEDNSAENQCDEYRSGKVSHFIELNLKDGEIVRIV
jgi:hypothetical protein